VLGAVACNSSGQYFASFRNKPAQFWRIFVINIVYFIGAKCAYTLFPAPAFLVNHTLPPKFEIMADWLG